MGKSTANLIRCVLVLLLCGAVALFVLWLPYLYEYVREILAKNGRDYFLSNLVYPIAALITLPVIALIAIAFRFPSEMSRDEIFSNATAKRLKLISNMIFSVCSVGIVAAILLLVIGDRVLAPLLLFAFSIGCVLALMLAVLSSYVKRAAILKEEVDHTL